MDTARDNTEQGDDGLTTEEQAVLDIATRIADAGVIELGELGNLLEAIKDLRGSE